METKPTDQRLLRPTYSDVASALSLVLMHVLTFGKKLPTHSKITLPLVYKPSRPSIRGRRAPPTLEPLAGQVADMVSLCPFQSAECLNAKGSSQGLDAVKVAILSVKADALWFSKAVRGERVNETTDRDGC